MVDTSDLIDRDDLTGFFLRKAFMPFFKKLVIQTGQGKKNLTIVHIDIDKFKRFNDKYGHYFGDLILKYVGSTLELSLRDVEHYTFRYGGDEFVIAFPGIRPHEALKAMQKCRKIMINRPFVYGYTLFRVTISCGLAGYPMDGESMDDLIAKADKAMYFSKRHGKGLITIVRQIPYIVARNMFFLLTFVGLILYMCGILYFNYYKTDVDTFFGKIMGIKIISNSKGFDKVIMKNGRIIEGYILDETDSKIVVNIYYETGNARAVFEKDSILEIKRRN